MPPHLPLGHGKRPVSPGGQLANPEADEDDIDAEGESDPEYHQHVSANLSDAEGSDVDGVYESDPEYPGPPLGHHADTEHPSRRGGRAEPYTPRPRKQRMSETTYREEVEAIAKAARDKTTSLRDHVHEDVNILYPNESQKHLDHRLQQIAAWVTAMLGPDALGRLASASREILEKNFQFLAEEIEAMSTAMFRLPTVRMFFTLDVRN
ncbi:hypothetical protein BMF94_2108 [Rhodotorula taiwanensis]|uniref:Uncharacterized protein n=1 Tax=Rhodotorula taiwanensis TaxID=741276 RepID=A0A2S5BDH6_9BASI|nr:hypothetical protein BMF94_2108 [Rhodotorula taiwanensis]